MFRKPGSFVEILLALTALAAIVSAVSPARAAFRDVGDPYTTIQEAIDAANDGDIVRIPEGVYNETVIVSKTLSLEGGWNADFSERDWETYVSAIDGSGTGRPVLVSSDRQTSVTLEGLTVQNGNATSAGHAGIGGGILAISTVSTSVVHIRHNIIRNNLGSEAGLVAAGAGVATSNVEVRLERNTIFNNVGTHFGVGQGGGIFVASSQPSVIADNVVTSNVASTSGPTTHVSGVGGGVFVVGDLVDVLNNQITSNTACGRSGGLGGGFYGICYDLEDNLVADNVATEDAQGAGGGVFSAQIFRISNNRIENNSAGPAAKSEGGGVYLDTGALVDNNWIRRNRAGRGGGLYMSKDGGATVFNNLIAFNDAYGTDTVEFDGGGGILCDSLGGSFLRNTITSNTATGFGGGVCFTTGTSISFLENTVTSNTALYGGGILLNDFRGYVRRSLVQYNQGIFGGGIGVFGGGNPLIDGNEIVDNTAIGFIFGGGGLVMGLDNDVITTVSNNFVARNAAGPSGFTGGLYASGGNKIRVYHNTFVDNDRGMAGDGLTFAGGADVKVQNSIIVGHTTGVLGLAGSSVTVDYCDFFDNVANMQGVGVLPGNRFDDPALVSRPAGDYHLAAGSPLVDQGLAPGGAVTTEFDFDGDPRPRGADPDIGADEVYLPEVYVSADDGDDVGGDGSPGSPFATIGKGVFEVQSGGKVHVAAGDYPEQVLIERNVNLLGGYNDTWTGRDLDGAASRIDAGGTTGSCVAIIRSLVHVGIDGFTLTNGFSGTDGFGGGLFAYPSSSVDMRRCRVTDNHAHVGGGGVFIYGSFYSPSHLIGNRFDNNRVNDYGPANGGGGLGIQGGPAIIRNNLIHDNWTDAMGDGALVFNITPFGSIDMFHNSIVDNGDASSSVGVELLIYLDPIDLRNNLIVGHTTGVLVQNLMAPSLADTVDFNGFFDNEVHVEGAFFGPNNRTGNPHFFDRAQKNYALGPMSAFLYSGDPNPAVMGPSDIFGNPRPWGIPIPEMGAHENITSPEIFATLLGVGPYPKADDLVGADVNNDGGVDVGDFLAIQNNGF